MYKKYFIIPLLCMAVACKQKTTTNLHAITDSMAIDSVQKDSTTTTKKNAISASQLIIPGKSIGNTHLHEDMDSVNKALGRADFGDAAMGASLSTWYAKHDNTDYQTTIYAHRYTDGKDDNVSRVKIIRITSPYFKTAENIHTGLPYAAVSNGYQLKQTGLYTKGKDSLKVYDDAARGIAFEINNANKCASILVHGANDRSAGYLALHQDMKFEQVKINP